MKELTKLSPELEGDIVTYEQFDFIVQDVGDREEAIVVVKSVKTIKTKIIEFFKESKENSYRAWKAVCANEKTFTDRLDGVESKAKQAILHYDAEQDNIRKVEQARLQAIEDERARKEQERLMKQADKLKSPERSEALMEMAASIVAPVVQVEEKEKTKGESTRKIWKARVIDPEKVPDIFKIIDYKSLDYYAKATKGAVPVEGVEFYEESLLAVKI